LNREIDISATIVLFKEDLRVLRKAIDSFLKIPLKKKLFLIDNSPVNSLIKEFDHPEIEYVFNNRNIGFAAGHNIIIDKIKSNSNYHLILNPDVEFKPKVILNLIDQLEKDNTVAMIAPRVVFPNGEHQYSCRRYPKVFELIGRRLPLLDFLFSALIKKGKYLDKDISKPFHADYLTGCFQLFKTEDFVKINGFDERYFLYMEDVDICKKIEEIGKNKLYWPKEQITHVLKKESSKKVKLFFTHFISSIKYFKKWGF